MRKWRQGDYTLDCTEFSHLKNQLNSISNSRVTIANLERSKNFIGSVVVSQTCDIISEPEKKPYVVACPLIKVDSDTFNEVKTGRRVLYGYLPNVDENIVVDFSRFMSIEKELLVTYDRIEGWDDEEQLQNFSSSVTRVFGRYAFPDGFTKIMNNFRKVVYKSHKKPESDIRKALDSICEFRVYPYSNWNDLESVPISFLAILDSKSKRRVESSGEIKGIIMNEINKIEWKKPFEGHSNILDVVEKSRITLENYERTFKFDFDFISISN